MQAGTRTAASQIPPQLRVDLQRLPSPRSARESTRLARTRCCNECMPYECRCRCASCRYAFTRMYAGATVKHADGLSLYAPGLRRAHALAVVAATARHVRVAAKRAEHACGDVTPLRLQGYTRARDSNRDATTGALSAVCARPCSGQSRRPARPRSRQTRRARSQSSPPRAPPPRTCRGCQ
jgi:hypothetical protein